MCSVHLEVTFKNRGIAGTCLDRLSHGAGLSVTILHGRITAEAAEFELELSGRHAAVEKAVWSVWNAASTPRSW